jgi:hypothetical protein
MGIAANVCSYPVGYVVVYFRFTSIFPKIKRNHYGPYNIW